MSAAEQPEPAPSATPLPSIDDLRHELVETLRREGVFTDARVEAAFRLVPRHLFLPGIDVAQVYRDEAIPTKFRDGTVISSSSQPAIMAIMLEQLDVQPGMRVLEIGAGTGYNAALLARLAGRAGLVVTVDIDEDIVKAARAHLAAAGLERVRVVCADGGLGWPEDAPYDRIILTVGASDITPAWWEQLRPGGRLVLPLSLRGSQVSLALKHQGDHLTSLSARPCGFIPLRGAFAEADHTLPLGPDPGLGIVVQNPRAVDPDSLYAALLGPHDDLPLGVTVDLREVFGGLSLWLALHEPDYCTVIGRGVPVERGVVPRLFSWSETAGATIGLAEGASLCLLVHGPDRLSERDRPEAGGVRLLARSFPPSGRLVRRLGEQVAAWDRAGRPTVASLHVQAYQQGTLDTAPPPGIVLDNRWTRLVVALG